MNSAQYRLEVMERVLNALEALENAGEMFYGAEACAIEDAQTALERHIGLALTESYEYEQDNS